MDAAHHWPQEIVVKPTAKTVTTTCTKAASGGGASGRKPRPQKEQALKCPRCNSTNTKFCYYNNYSLTQPRYFCKTCRRYWTEGGSLRNIPVGGGSRKNKTSNLSLLSLSSKKLPDLVAPPLGLSSLQNPNDNKILRGQDLNLAFPSTHDVTSFSQVLGIHNNSNNKSPSSTSQLSALELLTGISPRGLNPFLPIPVEDPNSVYTSGFPLQEPALNFSLEEASGKLLFPLEDVKQMSTENGIEENRELGGSSGYWSGMLGGGGGSW